MIRAALLSIAIATAAAPLAAAQGRGDGVQVTTHYSVVDPALSERDATVQGRFEGAAGVFYGGVNAATLGLGEANAKFDLYVGVRPRVGRLGFDIGYRRHLYDDQGDMGGELKLSVARPLGSFGSLRALVAVDPDAASARSEATANLRVLGRMSIGGGLGGEIGSPENGRHDRLTWHVGAARPFSKTVDLAMRYRGASDAAARASFSIAMRF